MIHTSYWRPRVYPFNGDVAPAQIDRLQDLTASSTLNREKIREIGRDGIVAWQKKIPTTRVTLRQYEYGDLEFYRKLGNVANSRTYVDLNDFKTSMVDICGFKTDDNGTFLGTVWYPKLRTAGFGINIGDPQSLVERTFDLVGEDETILQGTNEYFCYERFEASGGAPESFTVNDAVPVADPDNSGQYLLRVVRVSGSTTTELTYTTGVASGTTYAFSAPSTLTVATTAGDVIKVYYSAATFAESNIFVNNDTDAGALAAEACSIYLYVAADQYVYKLQSVGIDVAFDRADYYEIGNDEVIQRGVREKTVTVTLGRILDAYTIEEVLRGAVTDYGKITTRKYDDNTTLRVKMYGNSEKTSFNIGCKITDLSPTTLDAGVPLNDYATRNATLEADNLTISVTEATINA